MSDPAPSTAELGRLAVELARGAAGVVRAGRAEGFSVGVKTTATDLVTEVDKGVEAWLTAELARVRPHDAILGEEGGGRDGTSGVRWVLDPIDGTVNFVLDIPHFAVSVAAEVDGVVVAGAVCNPIDGELFRAERGRGAFLDGRRLAGPRDVPLARAVVGTGFGYDQRARRRQIAAVAPLLPRIADIRRIGSAALDLCYLAAGRLDAYFEAGLNPWDHAAGGLIAAEAGCVVSGLGDRPPSVRFLVACAPGLVAELHAALADVAADEVLDEVLHEVLDE